jgi:hypothetical protein
MPSNDSRISPKSDISEPVKLGGVFFKFVVFECERFIDVDLLQLELSVLFEESSMDKLSADFVSFWLSLSPKIHIRVPKSGALTRVEKKFKSSTRSASSGTSNAMV